MPVHPAIAAPPETHCSLRLAGPRTQAGSGRALSVVRLRLRRWRAGRGVNTATATDLPPIRGARKCPATTYHPPRAGRQAGAGENQPNTQPHTAQSNCSTRVSCVHTAAMRAGSRGTLAEPKGGGAHACTHTCLRPAIATGKQAPSFIHPLTALHPPNQSSGPLLHLTPIPLHSNTRVRSIYRPSTAVPLYYLECFLRRSSSMSGRAPEKPSMRRPPL